VVPTAAVAAVQGAGAVSPVFTASYVALWVVVVLLAVAVVVCLRQLGEVYLVSAGLRGVSGDGLDEGRTAPDLEVRLASGTPARLSGLLPAGGVLLFAAEQCHVCEELVPRLLDGEGPGAFPLVIAYDTIPERLKRPAEEAPVKLVEHAGSGALLSYKVRVTPFAFRLDGDLRVGSRGLVNNPEQVAFHAATPASPS